MQDEKGGRISRGHDVGEGNSVSTSGCSYTMGVNVVSIVGSVPREEVSDETMLIP